MAGGLLLGLLLLVSSTAPRWSHWLETAPTASDAADLDVPSAAATPAAGVEGRINVQLFFQARQASSLEAEQRSVPFQPELYGQIELVLQELVRGPQDPSLLPTLPPDTRVEEVFLLDSGVAVVNLVLPPLPPPPSPSPSPSPGEATPEASPGATPELLDPGPLVLRGSKEELLSVYSIVNTVTVNFPAVRRVRLLMPDDRGGLGKHVDLRQPLPADMTLVLPPEEWRLANGTGQPTAEPGSAATPTPAPTPGEDQ